VAVTFTRDLSTRVMSYGGRISCRAAAGEKTLDVVPQVYNLVHGKPLWFSISLVGRYQGPTPANPLDLSATNPYVPSHTYRVLAYGTVTLSNGHTASATVCSGSCAGARPLSVRPSSSYLAQQPTSVSVPGLPCVVGQEGLLFTLVNSTYVINYGGYSFCEGPRPQGRRSITICVQVGNLINGHPRWFTVSGSCLSKPPGSGSVFLSTARTAYIGHGYRLKVSSTVTYLTSRGTITRSATVYSAASGP
jgi:hypothetical protein